MRKQFSNGISVPSEIVHRAAVQAAFDAEEAMQYARRLLALPRERRGMSAREVHALVLKARATAARLADVEVGRA